MSVRGKHLHLVRAGEAPPSAPAAPHNSPARRPSVSQTDEGADEPCLLAKSEADPCALGLPILDGADYRVRRAIKLMNEDPRHSAEEVAARLKLTLSGLRQLFRKGIGVPPCHYLKHLRLHRVRSLLKTTDATVAEVIQTVCGTDASHFYRDFKEHFGLSPADYRAKVRAAADESWKDAPAQENAPAQEAACTS
jgi:AraC-like DNA-binding protein